MPDTASAGQTLSRSSKRRASSQQILLNRAKAATNGVRVGRPLSYSPALCDHVVALGMKGKSRAGIAAAFGISNQTLIDWERDFGEFREALARASVCSQDWWETHGQRNLKAKQYQSQVWRTTMAGRFPDYREQRVDNTGGFGDFLSAVLEVAAKHAPKLGAPGDAAKPVDAQVIDKEEKEPTKSGR